MKKSVFLYLTIILHIVFSQDEGKCAMYGECGSTVSGKLNCPYDGPPKPMNDTEGLQILRTYCPDLMTSATPLTCCDVNQLKTFESNMGLPQQLLLRCPSCFKNFVNLYCYFTCDPNQSSFIRVASKTKTSVTSVEYFMSTDYSYGMYNSCKDVQMPSTNQKALDIMCGQPADSCTPGSWLQFMGSTTNGKTPFQIDFHLQDTDTVIDNVTYHPLNYSITPCDKTYRNNSACSCQDCQAVCDSIPSPPQPTKPCTILGLECWFLAMIIVFVVFSVAFIACVIIQSCIKPAKSEHESKSDQEKPGVKYSSTQEARTVQYSEINRFEKVGAWMESKLESAFRWWGVLCATHPVMVIVIGVLIGAALSVGIVFFEVTTSPVRLWSSATSRSRTEKNYFDSNFGPFYRTEQLIITRPDKTTPISHHLPPPSVDSQNYSSIFEKEFLHMVLDLQLAVEGITADYEGQKVTLNDICLQPLAPDNTECTIQSILQYWQNSHVNIDKVKWDDFGFWVLGDYLDHFSYCSKAPATTSNSYGMSCLAASGQPIFPWISLGGFQDDKYNESTALVITFVVNNHLDEKENGKAEAWEAEFIKFMKNFTSPNMTISFSSERSIEDEIQRESASDVWTIVISYLVMFGYISITLGQFSVKQCSSCFVTSKTTLGLCGVVIVLLSVSSSLGLFSYCGVAATLIIIEVVPFLVLAVGVDNIFILVQAYQREHKSNDDVENVIGRVLGKVGPSMLLASCSESLAFFLGALTDMPAVKVFSLYSGMAVLLDFVMQVTVFVALMTIDAKRQETNRLDICCCVQLDKKNKKKGETDGILYKLFRDYYAHGLLSELMRPLVMLTFIGYLCFSVSQIHKIEIGLDQKLSMPDDSYVLNYFNNLSEYLHVGAPVYFVVEDGVDYKTKVGQDIVCGGYRCPQNSLVGQVRTASKLPQTSYIAQPASSWIDDYFDWLSPGGDLQCCRVHNNSLKDFCPATDNASCVPCPMEVKMQHRPSAHDFAKYLPWFLSDNPGEKCAKGGHAGYASGVKLLNNKKDVGATYFMTYHSIMKDSKDYISGLREARKVGDNITRTLHEMTGGNATKVFPYSVFYVYYEQYLTIVKDTIQNLCICVAAIFVVTFILLGFDILSAFMVVITIAMIVVDILGFMYLWDISLNAVSLVNLVMAVGISVEFCAHITRAFAVSLLSTRVDRAKDALSRMGSSVLSGITLTKLGGIIVLAFATSQLFQVFYFRMYLAMVVYGASHGLIFLPVLLSYIGPPVNKARLYKTQTESMYEQKGFSNKGFTKSTDGIIDGTYTQTYNTMYM